MSYDLVSWTTPRFFKLKGHQIIGELRRCCCCWFSHDYIEGSPDHWWVTTVVVDLAMIIALIEGSPDHWWVTTVHCCHLNTGFKLKGHQIIGELRHILLKDSVINSYWRVTRSLVSYDSLKAFLSTSALSIEGSPDHWWVTTSARDDSDKAAADWRVTRSLVSYDMVTRIQAT